MCFSKAAFSKASGQYANFVVKLNQEKLFFKIIDFLKTNNFYRVEGNKDFFEIFCTKQAFEYTVTLAKEDDNRTIVNAVVYSDENKGGAKKRLKSFLNLLKDNFVNLN